MMNSNKKLDNNSAPVDVFCVFDEKGEFVHVSNSCQKLWGYEPAELLGKTYMDIVVPDDHELTKKISSQLISGMDVGNFQNRYIHKTGTIVPVYWTAHYDSCEKKLLGVCRGAGPEKRSITQTKRNETRFLKLIQNSTDGLALLDKKGRIIEVSNPGIMILGLAGKEINEDIRRNIHQDDVHLMNEALFDLLNDPENIKIIEFRLICAGDKNIWIEATLQNEMNEPAVRAIVMNFCNITDRKVAELAIVRSEKLRKKIMNSALEAIICTDPNGIVILWNNQAENIFGYKREEMIGKEMIDAIVPAPYRNRLKKGILNYLRKNDDTLMDEVFEIKAFNRDGKEFPVELRIIPLEQEDELLFCAFIRDITERKNSEAEKEQLLHKIQKRVEELAISNADLEQFVYIASHDLQEPLRMVTSFLTRLEAKYKDQLDEKARQYIYFATDGAARMRRIILDLLEYSRVGRKEYELVEVDMNKVLEDIIQFHRITIREKRAEVKWDELPVIIASRIPLEQVLQNLIGNALKYQAPGVKPEIYIRSVETQDEWQFTVSDNGIGIDPQFYNKIFILFQRLHQKEQYSGTGIGLAVCKKIVDNFGGRIWVESEEGKGSKFHFTLPKRQ